MNFLNLKYYFYGGNYLQFSLLRSTLNSVAFYHYKSMIKRVIIFTLIIIFLVFLLSFFDICYADYTDKVVFDVNGTPFDSETGKKLSEGRIRYDQKYNSSSFFYIIVDVTCCAVAYGLFVLSTIYK